MEELKVLVRLDEHRRKVAAAHSDVHAALIEHRRARRALAWDRLSNWSAERARRLRSG